MADHDYFFTVVTVFSNVFYSSEMTREIRARVKFPCIRCVYINSIALNVINSECH